MTKKKKKDEEQKREKIVYKDIKVSFWRTRLHDEELGLHQEMKYQAKTRWYSKSFDMEGLIEVDDKKEYVIAFNKKDWEDAPKDANKRFILRIFTIMEEEFDGKDLKGGNYHGGIELSITHSLVQSFEVKRPAPVFFIQLPRDINLYRVVAGWRLIGTRWSWPLLPEKKGDKLQMILAKGVIGPGRNYKIYLGDVLIARIDGQPIQKEYEIEIYNEDYAKDTTFVKQLILFACSCEFMDESEKMIKRLFKKMKKTGTSDYKIPKSERDLFRNPRMMRR
ncbi:MAG: hypothetical protein ACQERB_13600 [Promethearchaeati archaeon]